MDKLIFAGSFDPLSIAHEDIIARAEKMSRKLVIAIAHNSQKKYQFSLDMRVKMIEKAVEKYNDVEVVVVKGLVVDYAENNNIKYQLRAIRNSNDLIYEQDLYYNNSHINKDIESIYLLSKQELSHVSSSRIREFMLFNKPFNHLVSDEIYTLIMGK